MVLQLKKGKQPMAIYYYDPEWGDMGKPVPEIKFDPDRISGAIQVIGNPGDYFDVQDFTVMSQDHLTDDEIETLEYSPSVSQLP
jgi:hypothetical protein